MRESNKERDYRCSDKMEHPKSCASSLNSCSSSSVVYPSEVFSETESAYDVFDLQKIPSIFSSYDESINFESQTEFNMTSLGAFMFLSQNESKCSFGFKKNQQDEGHDQERLSLAYERLHSMPKILLNNIAHKVKILDISYNEFDNLDFLKNFKQLTMLICDHNNINSKTLMPQMPKLELLWMNNCKINELYPWVKYLQESCPNLKYFSLMGNKAAPSYLNGGNFYEYLQYRLFVISLFSNLHHLDDRLVTSDQVEEAKRLYKKPIFERLCITSLKLPKYLKSVSELFTQIPPNLENKSPKNIII